MREEEQEKEERRGFEYPATLNKTSEKFSLGKGISLMVYAG